ncbi:DMT family transporter [Tissierella sp. Yu-01]|uniref:DMT family transporter n=1 Tax=Tissierella sp. Yu-01 TaxID=3035694 RepID=UPI00240DAB6D|nr:DMT family transporter [Tissierella sp. Yu-01]WFA09968.1 DMT family transporter [Tissierella sp. Yu-01]
MEEQHLNKNRSKGILYCVLAAVLWSTGGILIKLIDWNPIAISGLRSLIASLVILAYMKKPKMTKSKPLFLGAGTYAITVFMFVIANKLTTSANVILLQFTAPIFVAILSAWLLHEKIVKVDVIAIIFVFLGMTLFFVQNISYGNALGNVLAILSGFFLACTTIALRLQKDGSAIESTFLGNVITFIIAIPFILQVKPDIRSIIFILILGIFQLGISYVFYVNGLKYVTALEGILLTVLEPILNPVWVFLISGEKPGILAVVGGIIVVGSVIARGVYISKKEAEDCK